LLERAQFIVSLQNNFTPNNSSISHKTGILLTVAAKTFSTNGIVLKRTNVGETDRIVVLLTQDFGKLACVAKGVRKLSSSKRAFLEPGNYVRGFFVPTKSLPLLTQATLIEDCSSLERSLVRMRQITQVLEIFEKLFVEQELDEETFARALHLRARVVANQATGGFIRTQLRQIIMSLGYQDPEDSKYDSITDFISALSDRPMRSFEYLTLATDKK
jgi:recombinational DNA repair protein (RecF pathway)